MNSEGVSANKTRVYSDTVASQHVMVGLYLFLPIWMALLVPMVSRIMSDASAVRPSYRAGDQNEKCLQHSQQKSRDETGC